MLEILKFIFSSFWVWLGTLILVAAVAEGLGGLIRISRCKNGRWHSLWFAYGYATG